MSSDQPSSDSAQSSDLLDRWVREFAAGLPGTSSIDWTALMQALAEHSDRAREIQERYYRLHLDTWSQLLAEDAPPAGSIDPAPGDHRFDDRLTDYSAETRAKTLANNKTFLQKLEPLTDTTKLTGPNQIDVRTVGRR